MADKKTQLKFWLFVFIAAAFYYGISSVGNPGVFAVTVLMIVFGVVAFVMLLHSDSDERFYKPLNAVGLAVAVAAGVCMMVVASVFTAAVNLPASTVGSSSVVPLSFSAALSSAGSALAVVQVPSSYITNILSDLLYTAIIVAGVEELTKLAGISLLLDGTYKSILKAKNRGQIARYTLLLVGVLGLPVVLWVLWHGIESYSDLRMLVPAFINGVVLLVLLLKFGWMAAIIAHGAVYNGIVVVMGYLQGNVVASGLPLFAVKTYADVMVLVLAALCVLFVVVPVLLQRNKNTA